MGINDVLVSAQQRRTDSARIDQQLLQASKLVEEAAYALAGDVPTDKVVRLMLIAADIDRLASGLRATASSGGVGI